MRYNVRPQKCFDVSTKMRFRRATRAAQRRPCAAVAPSAVYDRPTAVLLQHCITLPFPVRACCLVRIGWCDSRHTYLAAALPLCPFAPASPSSVLSVCLCLCIRHRSPSDFSLAYSSLLHRPSFSRCHEHPSESNSLGRQALGLRGCTRAQYGDPAEGTAARTLSCAAMPRGPTRIHLLLPHIRTVAHHHAGLSRMARGGGQK